MTLINLKRNHMSGFTMIELLVVIAIIGVLAAAVLSAINPVEQINKGRDTRSRSDAAELVNAVERYYAVQEEFPWNTPNGAAWNPTTMPAGSPVGIDPDNSILVNGGAASAWRWMDILEATDEVKENFVGRVQSDAADYILMKETAAGTTYMCFAPQSTQFQQEAVNRCNATDPGLPSATAYWNAVCDDGGPGSAVLGDADIEYICVP